MSDNNNNDTKCFVDDVAPRGDVCRCCIIDNEDNSQSNRYCIE